MLILEKAAGDLDPDECPEGLIEANFNTIVMNLLTALQTLDRAGIVHMDIKPANILYFEHPFRAVLGDMGMAHNVGMHVLGKILK